MKENLGSGIKKLPYLKGGLAAFAFILLLGGGFLTIKGPSLIKSMAQSSLERNLAPLGIKQIEIDTINFGWGRFYLRDIHSNASPSEPSLNIQEMDVALSLLLNVKAIDVVGATMELKEGDKISFSRDDLQNKAVRFGKVISQMKQLKLPTIALRDCLLIIPSSQGPLKLPIHATTETTVSRNQILTVDWGEYGENKFSGQFVLDSGRKGLTVDIHMANIDVQTPSFQIRAPEISLWGTTVHDAGEGYNIDGFAKLERLMLEKYGTLKQPLEVNLGGEGTPENLVLDGLTITTTGKEKNLIELEGSFKPNDLSGQVILTTQIAQLSNLWDFTPLLATHAEDKVSVGGKLNLTSEIHWESGHIKTSVLALEVKGGALHQDEFTIEGANTQFVFDSLTPVTTRGEQSVSAKKLSISGIDLKNVAFQCQFDKDGLFQIKKFVAETLKGSLVAHRFQRFVKGTKPAFQFETDFKNIELAEILKLTDLDTLSGRAKLAGNASMSYSAEDGLDILQGELHSISESGHIQYQAENSKKEGDIIDQKNVNMAFQVLDNLNFTIFNVRLEHDPSNPTEMQGIVKMLGSNPNVLNGYPFEFNIVTTGKLKDLVMNTLKHMGPPGNLSELNQAIKETKEAKALKKAMELAQGPQPEVAKAIEGVKVPKVAQKTHSGKKAKRAKIIKAKKILKVSKKVKKIKGTKAVKQENRKLSNG